MQPPASSTTPTPRPPASSRSRRLLGLLGPLLEDRGSATAEYAIATMAAVGFAGLLVVILRGDEVRSALAEIIHRALTAGV
ncbi:hypothetical protein B7R54_03340 [Subtercola boreus]|uniref:DUF4244 domain-containing protein n=1 Tax=Subtercola boreus TaxID=120213 RepID=A0A3E0VEL2_9MICO|nr:DUF4244 domain-containing protein [Subtercola boreus]RFA08366.1 hypothetical protein B7R54_03340 [Subtercola boreus]TQL54729.1 uncharacterized protein DUF4244 [Subtercola boreus]